MQKSTDQAEAFIPTETSVIKSTNLNRPVTVRCNTAKRTLPFDLRAEEIQLALPPPPQGGDIPAMKKPRLEEYLPLTTDQDARKNASPDVSGGLNPPADDKDDTNANPVTDTQPNTWATGEWTLEEDAKLTWAIAYTRKKYGKKRKIDWAAICVLVPGRTKNQCYNRWHSAMNPNIGQANGHTNKWVEGEDSEAKDAVQFLGDKDWAAISALVPGRTEKRCHKRWHDTLDPSTGRESGRKGKWTSVEDSKLTDAVQTHGDKDWVAISALVPSRTKKQCRRRWHDVLDPNIGRANRRMGKWAEHEDSKLKDAVQTHGDKKGWGEISDLVPGRTLKQCWNRWNNVLNPSISQASGRKGSRWTEDEDSTLKNVVKTHGGVDWVAISLHIPGRTKSQCRYRWHDVLDPSIDRVSGRTGKWSAVEDRKLKDALQMHRDRDWGAISALVPGRTLKQCNQRWNDVLDPSIGRANGRTGTWEEDEDSKLKDAVQTHGDKDWAAISALVPGRTRSQCKSRWHDTLDPSSGRATGRKGKWTAVEDSQLKDAIQLHGDKDWVAISLLVPDRTKKQCWNRWKYKDPNRSAVLGTEHGTLDKAPAVGHDRDSPCSTTNSRPQTRPPGALPSLALTALK